MGYFVSTTRYTIRALIAVPVAQRDAANDACEAVAKGGRGTFRVQWPPQDDTGTVAAEYYLCSWQMLPEQRTKLDSEFAAHSVTPIILDADHWDPVRSTVKYEDLDADLKVRTGRTVSFAAMRMAPLATVRTAGRWGAAIVRSWWHRLWATLLRFLRRWFTRQRG